MFNFNYPRDTRLASSGCIRVSKPKANLSLTMMSFKWRASAEYNRLPAELRKETDVAKFKKAVKAWVAKNN